MSQRYIFISVLLLVLFSKVAYAQSYIADTIYADFEPDTAFVLKNNLTAADKRGHDPQLISIFEKKKWLFFPVDQIVYSKKLLAKGLENNTIELLNKSYHLNIHEFYIDQYQTMFNRNFTVNGAFQLFNTSGTDTVLLGAFYYEKQEKFKKKAPIDVAYSKTLNNFKSEFIWDLNAVCNDTLKNRIPGQNHFREGQVVATKNFYISTDIFYGYTFWGFDAEVYFSSPEPAKKYTRKSGMVRFMQFENRQTVGFSKGVKYLNYRYNAKWLFQNKSSFLLGFNKWNDIDEQNRTLEELFLLQFSMMQKATFNPLDKSGFVVGLGIMEEISYVVYNEAIFNIALVFNCAYKF